MDLRSLRYFCAAAELGSITAAAEHCHVAQPSISNAVAQLEAEFALRLFSRSRRGVSLTPAGRDFHQQARQLLRNAEQVEARFKQRRRSPLQLGIHRELASRDSAWLVQLLSRSLPDHQLEVRSQPQQPPALWLTSARRVPAGYRFVSLLDQQYHLLAPRGWPLPQPLALEAALDYPWIDRLDCEQRAALLSRLPQLSEHCLLQVDTEDLAMSLVQHQQGVTVMALSDDTEGLPADIQAHSLQGLVPAELLGRQLGVALREDIDAGVAQALGLQ
ncbi:LysR family transcriptional regulator [Halopseudomonas sp.]|uniref:LysR family transcriptional regulator n=1 Tax=Halopseudomonas sp. TaxID=2901191 RepID=UPI0030012BA5